MTYQSLLAPILSFLHCETPDARIDAARRPENLQLLLTDHGVRAEGRADRHVADPPLRGGQRAATRCWRCCALTRRFCTRRRAHRTRCFAGASSPARSCRKTARPTAGSGGSHGAVDQGRVASLLAGAGDHAGARDPVSQDHRQPLRQGHDPRDPHPRSGNADRQTDLRRLHRSAILRTLRQAGAARTTS